MKNLILFSLVFFFNTAYSMKLELGDILAGFIQVKAANNEQALPILGGNLASDSKGILYGIVSGGINQTNLATGEQRTIIPNGNPESFTGIAIDNNDQIIAYEGTSFSRIDPITGNLTVITSGTSLTEVSAIAIDNNDILVGAKNSNFDFTLLRINATTGLISPIASENDPNGEGFLGQILTILVDKEGNYIVRDWNNQFHKIDRNTGDRIQLFPEFQLEGVNGDIISLLGDSQRTNDRGGFIDENNKLVIINSGQVLRINLETNIAEILFAEIDRSLSDIIPSSSNNIFLRTSKGISEFNLTTLEFSMVKNYFNSRAITNGTRAFNVSKSKEIFYALDTAVFKLDAFTGIESPIASDGLLNKINAIEIAENGTLVISSNDRLADGGSVILVDPITGAQNAISSGKNLKTIKDIALDGNGNIYVLTSNFVEEPSCIVKIDADTGVQTIVNITESQLPGFCFRQEGSLVIERSGNIIVSDPTKIFRLNISSGSVTELAERGEPSDTEKFYRAEDIALAPDGSIVILGERLGLDQSAVFKIDSVTGVQSKVSSSGLLAFFNPLQCKCLSVVSGDVINSSEKPIPNIHANGHTDMVLLQEGQNLSVSITLEPGVDSGQVRDWWVAANSPFGLFWLNSQLQWVKSENPIRGYKGPLTKLTNFTILSPTILPTGSYTFYFGVDSNADNILDADNFDFVNVTIQ